MTNKNTKGQKVQSLITPEGVKQVITPSETRGKRMPHYILNSVGVELLRSSCLDSRVIYPEFHSGLSLIELLRSSCEYGFTIFLRIRAKLLSNILRL